MVGNAVQNFEEAQIHGCIFEFKPTSAYAVAGTQAMGNVILATDYDVVDANYANKREMEIVEFSSSAMSNVCQIHPIECDPKQNVLAEHYIQYGATSIADFPDDPRFGCMGNFQVATNGMPTTGEAVGELWVTYDVELRKPQLAAGGSGPAEYHLGGTLNEEHAFTATKETWGGFPLAGAASPFKYEFSGSADDTTSVHIQCLSGNGSVGSYIVSLNVAGTDMATTGVAVTLGPGVTSTNLFASDSTESGAYGATATNAGATSQVTIAAITFTEPGQTFALGIGTAADTTFWDLVITKYNPGFASTRARAKTSLDKKLEERDQRLERLEKLLLGQQKQVEWEAGAAAAALPILPRVTPASIWKISPTDTRLVNSLQRRAVVEAPLVGPLPRVSPGLSTDGSTSGSNKK